MPQPRDASEQRIQNRTVTQVFLGGIAEVDEIKSTITAVSLGVGG